MEQTNNSLKISANPKTFFLYLLMIIAFYTCIINFIDQIFTFIDLLLPAPLDRSYLYVTFLIRRYIATLVIAFPTYVVLFALIRRDYLQFPENKTLIIRKWAAYLAIFVATATILCSAAILVYYFLAGDFTIRFLLKIFVIFIIFAWILYFYLHDLKMTWQASQLKIIGVLTSLLIIGSISYGLVLTGSPFKARLIQFDQQRITELMAIQNQIIQYQKDKNKLPASLDELTSAISGFKAPSDPQTHFSYDYRVRTNSSFELCANFNLASTDRSVQLTYDSRPAYDSSPQNWSWQHREGYACFQRTLDTPRKRK